jgi:hypothetical protein
MRQADLRTLIVDEAHHMAGYKERETQAYRLGHVLSKHTRHIILATATPHRRAKELASQTVAFVRELADAVAQHDGALVIWVLPGHASGPRDARVVYDGEAAPPGSEKAVAPGLAVRGEGPEEGVRQPSSAPRGRGADGGGNG